MLCCSREVAPHGFNGSATNLKPSLICPLSGEGQVWCILLQNHTVNGGIFMSQNRYIEQYLQLFSLSSSQSVTTLMV